PRENRRILGDMPRLARAAGSAAVAVLLGGCDVASPAAVVEPKPAPDAGADAGCEPGETPSGDTCAPPGVPPSACAQGFEPDGANGCRAVVPPEVCGPGTMAVPGETSCREITPCGSGTYGDAPVDGSTVYVDASFADPSASD